MPIDAGGQPLDKRNDHAFAWGVTIHGTYTVADVAYMHAYLCAIHLPDPERAYFLAKAIPRGVSGVIDAFERECPDIGVAQVRAVISVGPTTLAWCYATFGIEGTP
jgi:hypothetical protein